MKLRLEGKKQDSIAEIVGCSQVTVSKWISKYKSGRTLETLPRSGRPTKLQRTTLNLLRRKIVKEVKAANKNYCSLSTKEMSDIIKKEVGHEFSLRHVERILHKLGFSLITPRPEHIRHDQRKVDQFRDEFKKKSRRNMWVMYLSHSTKQASN